MAADIELNAVLNSTQFLHELGKMTGLIVDFSTKADKAAKQVNNAFSSIKPTISSNSAKNNFGLNLDEEQLKSLPRLRYALYDISAAANQASQSMIALSTTVVDAARSYETSFTNVQRTLDQSMGTAAVENLKEELKSLAEQIPLTFDQITSVASLGSQLGIASTDLAGFTDTVSKFSAVTNVSTESAAQSFGALGELLGFGAGAYEQFGSAVAYAGTKSVATESEILSVATQIGGVAGAAGFSAERVVGLSTALASLRIPAEQSRGALTRVFQEVNRAAATGGEELQHFANVIGMSAEEAKALAQTDMATFFDKFIQGMQGMDPSTMTQTLDSLNLSELRVTNTLTRLAANYDLVTKSQNNATKAYNDGTFLTDAYGIKADDLNSKLQILQNTFQNLAATIGDGLLPILKPIIDAAINVGKGFEMMISSGIMGGFAQAVIVITALSAAVLAVGAVVATAVAGTFALTTAFTGLVADGILPAESGLARLIGWFLGIDISAVAAKAAQEKLAVAQAEVAGTAAVATGAVSALGRAETTAALEAAGLIVAEEGLAVASTQAAGTVTGLQLALAGLGIVGAIVAVGSIVAGLVGMNAVTKKASSGTSNWAKTVADAEANAKKLKGSTDGASDSIKNMGNTAGGAAAKVRTLVDYANDLSSVWSRAFDIRFSSGSALDNITKSFNAIRKSSADAAREISSLNADIASLTADKALQEYYLSVALAQGDMVTAARIQGNLAGINANLATKNQALASAQEEANMTLTGNSDAAIENRGEIRNLVAQYQSYIQTLAASGASQAELAAATAQAKADFIAQATQLGYNATELSTYAAAFDDVNFAIANVPRDVTVDINTNPAQTALDELLAKAVSTATGMTDAFNNVDTTPAVEQANNVAIAIEEDRRETGLYKDRITEVVTNFDTGWSAMAQKSNLTSTGMTTDFGNYSDRTISKFREVAGVGQEETGKIATTWTNMASDMPISVRAQSSNVRSSFNTVGQKASEGFQAGGSSVFGSNWWNGILKSIFRFKDGGIVPGYASGGYISGPGGPRDDKVPAMLSAGEYVMNAASVKKYGAGFFDQLNQMQMPRYFSPASATSSSGSGMVSLSPEDRALLRNIGGSGNIVLYADSRELARSVNDGNRQIVASGGRP